MSNRFKIPREIKDPAILLNGNSAKIIEKDKVEAMCDLRDGKKPSARRCGFQKSRSDRWPGTKELDVNSLIRRGTKTRAGQPGAWRSRTILVALAGSWSDRARRLDAKSVR
jgi:hypothetical protein